MWPPWCCSSRSWCSARRGRWSSGEANFLTSENLKSRTLQRWTVPLLTPRRSAAPPERPCRRPQQGLCARLASCWPSSPPPCRAGSRSPPPVDGKKKPRTRGEPGLQGSLRGEPVMGREAHHGSHFTTFLRRPIRHFATALRPRWMRLCCPLATAEDYRFRRRATPQFGHAASFHWSVRSREESLGTLATRTAVSFCRLDIPASRAALVTVSVPL